MGIYKTTYVGPFLVIDDKRVHKTKVTACPNACRDYYLPNAKFCETCGSALEESVKTHETEWSARDLEDEYDLPEEMLASWEWPRGVLVPNMAIDGVHYHMLPDVSDFVESLDPDSLAAFTEHPIIADLIERLTEDGVSHRTCYGVVILAG